MVGATDASIRNTGAPQSIPLAAGDSISFYLGVDADPTQKTMNGGSIDFRSYNITLNLV
jgi:hypothetical protein